MLDKAARSKIDPCLINVCLGVKKGAWVNFRSCDSGSERKLVVRFSTRVYERIAYFSLPWSKYWFNLQTVSENKFCFGLKKVVGWILF